MSCSQNEPRVHSAIPLKRDYFIEATQEAEDGQFLCSGRVLDIWWAGFCTTTGIPSETF